MELDIYNFMDNLKALRWSIGLTSNNMVLDLLRACIMLNDNLSNLLESFTKMLRESRKKPFFTC